MKADFKRFLNLHTLQGKMFVIILAVALLVMALSLTLCCYLCVDAVEELTAGYMTNYIRFADETLSEKLDNAVMTSLTVTADQEIVHETIQSSAALASYRWFQQYKPTVSLLNGVISDKPYDRRARAARRAHLSVDRGRAARHGATGRLVFAHGRVRIHAGGLPE